MDSLHCLSFSLFLSLNMLVLKGTSIHLLSFYISFLLVVFFVLSESTMIYFQKTQKAYRVFINWFHVTFKSHSYPLIWPHNIKCIPHSDFHFAIMLLYFNVHTQTNKRIFFEHFYKKNVLRHMTAFIGCDVHLHKHMRYTPTHPPRTPTKHTYTQIEREIHTSTRTTHQKMSSNPPPYTQSKRGGCYWAWGASTRRHARAGFYLSATYIV